MRAFCALNVFFAKKKTAYYHVPIPYTTPISGKVEITGQTYKRQYVVKANSSVFSPSAKPKPIEEKDTLKRDLRLGDPFL